MIAMLDVMGMPGFQHLGQKIAARREAASPNCQGPTVLPGPYEFYIRFYNKNLQRSRFFVGSL